jgi:putative monooxygenase
MTTRPILCTPVRYADVSPNIRRGGDLRVLLSSRSVGATAGFMGAGTLAPGERITEHYHPYSEEFIYLVRGRITLYLDGEPVEVGAGEAVMVPIGVRHRIVNTGNEEMFAVFFLGPLAPRPELGHVDTEPLPRVDQPVPDVGGGK